MYKLYAPPNPRFLSAFRDLYPRSQKQFRVELQTVVKPVLQKQVDETFGGDPGPVKYKIEWETEKQRRAFFATDGFGQGIPTKRTRQLEDSWIVEVSTQMRVDLITLRNPKSYAKYVYPGSRQQRMHKRTGWGKNFDKYLRDLQRTEDIEIANAWSRAVKFALRTK